MASIRRKSSSTEPPAVAGLRWLLASARGEALRWLPWARRTLLRLLLLALADRLGALPPGAAKLAPARRVATMASAPRGWLEAMVEAVADEDPTGIFALGEALPRWETGPGVAQALGELVAWLDACQGAGLDPIEAPGRLHEALVALEVTLGVDGEVACSEAATRARGAHYTPRPLARWLAARTLAPLMDGQGRWELIEPRPPEALLALKVCDLAVGGGVLLIEAARVMAEALVDAWALHGGGPPPEEAPREALRAVIASSLHGVELDAQALGVACASLQLLTGRLGGAEVARLACGDAVGMPLDVLDSKGKFSWSGAFGEALGEGGFDAVLGNPPYLSGGARPEVEASYGLKRRGWDAWWLFVERGAQVSKPGAAWGYILPDAALARESTRLPRAFMLARAGRLWVRHEGAVFAAAVGTVACCGHGPGPAREMVFERPGEGAPRAWPLEGEPARDAELWPPRRVPEGGTALRDVVVITRGEELGIGALSPAQGGAQEVLVGRSVRRPFEQPSPSHAIDEALRRKPPEVYAAPKVVMIKTGRQPRAAMERRGLVTLQSLYNLHLAPGAAEDGWTLEFVCGLLNARAAWARFITPITDGKRYFPQITQRMVLDIRVPDPPAALVEEATALVRRLEQAPQSRTLRDRLEALYEGLYEAAGW